MAALLLRIAPRLALLGTAIAQFARGDVLYGVFCLIALVCSLGALVFPLALELAILWLMVTDMTLGNTLGLYQLAWYDKALHLTSSILVAFVVRHFVRGAALTIFLITVGVGALWEVSEYAVDTAFGRRSQGAPNQSALDDTMIDLAMDTLGAALGAIAGRRWPSKRRKTR